MISLLAKLLYNGGTLRDRNEGSGVRDKERREMEQGEKVKERERERESESGAERESFDPGESDSHATRP